jgi:hypothetical protein
MKPSKLLFTAIFFGMFLFIGADSASAQESSKCSFRAPTWERAKFPFQCNDKADMERAKSQCEKFSDENSGLDTPCTCTGCNDRAPKKAVQPPANQSSNESVKPPDNSPSPDAEIDARAEERRKAYEAQKRGRKGSPIGIGATVVTQRMGESDEDFRARERAAAYEDQKRREKAQAKKPEEKIKGDESKGFYETGNFRVTFSGVKGATGNAVFAFEAVITNKEEFVAMYGCCMVITNPNSEFPLYYKIKSQPSWDFIKLDPGEKRLVNLGLYNVPRDAKGRPTSYKYPARSEEIEVKYFVYGKP